MGGAVVFDLIGTAQMDARLQQLYQLAPWLRDSGLLSPELVARVRQGREIAGPLSQALSVRGCVVRKLFRDWDSDVAAAWGARPVSLARTLEHTPEAFWPSGDEGWCEWNLVMRDLARYGLDDHTFEAVVPPMIAARARDQRLGRTPIRPDSRWVTAFRAIVVRLAQAAPSLNAKRRERILSEALLRDQVRHPDAWLTEIEAFWRQSFQAAYQDMTGAPKATAILVPRMEWGGWTLEPLTQLEDLEIEGEEMRNCLREHLGQLLCADALYFRLADSGMPKGTIEIRLFDAAPYLGLGDVQGPGHTQVNPHVNRTIESWVAHLQGRLGADEVRSFRSRCAQSLRPYWPTDWQKSEREKLWIGLPFQLQRVLGNELESQMH